MEGLILIKVGMLMVLFIGAPLAMAVWIERRRMNHRPWLVGWLITVGLLIFPWVLMLWVFPQWQGDDRLAPLLVRYLVYLPGALAGFVLFSGLPFLLIKPAARLDEISKRTQPFITALVGKSAALGEEFKEYGKGVEWDYEQRDDKTAYYGEFYQGCGSPPQYIWLESDSDD